MASNFHAVNIMCSTWVMVSILMWMWMLLLLRLAGAFFESRVGGARVNGLLPYMHMHYSYESFMTVGSFLLDLRHQKPSRHGLCGIFSALARHEESCEWIRTNPQGTT